ncbi:MAG: DUF3037 domain-containing protein [Saprospiraceae bacterium]
MPDNVTYEFAVIRVVPRVEREEFLNVGVIVYCKHKKYLALRYHLDESRLACFSGAAEPALLADYLRAWEQVCAGAPAGGRIGALEQHVRFRWLTAARSTIIQSSPTHPGLCDDPAGELERLFGFFVG